MHINKKLNNAGNLMKVKMYYLVQIENILMYISQNYVPFDKKWAQVYYCPIIPLYKIYE